MKDISKCAWISGFDMQPEKKILEKNGKNGFSYIPTETNDFHCDLFCALLLKRIAIFGS